MKKKLIYIAVLAMTVISCTQEPDIIIQNIKEPIKGDQAELQLNIDPNESTFYRELWRPQIHYTPAKNWINDPNGMVYADGVWHMYYQYNPNGQEWGNMSWGHATSTDLFHWKEQPVAIMPDELGYIYSGSAIIDKDNTAGFGANTLIAIYTAHGDHEQQCIAYSKDGGMSFTKYEGNPVIKNNIHGDYRDPKVFWDDAYKCWYMIFALGGEHSAQIWKSTNLKEWTICSTFSVPAFPKCNIGVWECTDMFTMLYKGTKKYVITVNISGGFPNGGGSGIMYFVGDFDGKRFTLDNYNYPLWEDQGLDNYASVTWSNIGDRRVSIGWMNNQLYSGNYPCKPWRSAMTLPREMVLEEYNGFPLLKSTIAKEIEGIAEAWRDAKPNLEVTDSYQLKIPVSLSKDCYITLSNEQGNNYKVKVDAQNRQLIIDRGGDTGTYSAREFPLTNVKGPLNTDKQDIVLYIYVDQSSVEITTEDGSVIMTTLVFPEKIYDLLRIEGQDVKPQVRNLTRVW